MLRIRRYGKRNRQQISPPAGLDNKGLQPKLGQQGMRGFAWLFDYTGK
jgi:hypothetical protein